MVRILIALITLTFFGAVSWVIINYTTTQNTPVVPFTNLNPSQNTPTNTLKGKVIYLSGSAWTLINGRKTEIKENDLLNEGDVITTDEETRLVIELDDGSVIRVGDDSNIILSQLKSSQITIEEQKGAVFARVNKDDKHLFLVKAGDYTVKSLGTSFSVEKDEEVRVRVFESKVQVEDKEKKETLIFQQQQWQEKKRVVEKLNEKEVSSNKFLSWSVSEEVTKKANPTPTKKAEIKPTAMPKPIESVSNKPSQIFLAGKQTDGGIYLKWEVSDIDISKGFKVVKSLGDNPVYPGNDNVYLDNSGTRNYTWPIKDGQTWHFRVCQYTGNGCGVYSNEITVQAPKIESAPITGEVKNINISGEKIGEGKVRINWTVEGASPKGYKVVWSTNSGPTYPLRSGDRYHYASDPSARTAVIEELSSGSSYYFRVCEYLGGQCGLYSNEISLGL